MRLIWRRGSTWGPLFLLVFLATGCSVLNWTTDMDVIATTEADSVVVYRDAGLTGNGANWSEAGLDSTRISLSNLESYHLIRFEKRGHADAVVPLLPSRRNPYKWLDAGLAIAGIGAMIIGIPIESTGLIAGGFFTAFYNGLGLIFPPKLVYQNRLEGPELIPLPTHEEGQPQVDLHTVDLAIDSGEYRWTYYEDMQAYLDGENQYQSFEKDEMMVRDSNLDSEPRKLLVDQGFLPETRVMFEDKNVSKLSCNVRKVMEHRAGGLIRYDIESDWAIHNPYSLSTDTVSTFTKSEWSGFVIGEGLRRDLLSDCIEQDLVSILKGETALNWIQASDRDVESEWKQDWDTLSLSPVMNETRRISQSLDAVVTITSGEGHGSGCIIDADGWIVTNHHVVEDTSRTHNVHFANGAVLPAKVVRWDPVVDVALLRVDSTGLKTMSLRPADQPIEIGDPVYAIGTPYDQGLDASVTRGIISGRRGSGNQKRLQTDVSISPGNSGGALLDEEGRWLGVVNAKLVAFDVEGIGFAIPAETLPAALRLEFN